MLRKLSQLPLDVPHPIVGVQIEPGKYGEAPLVELDDCKVFLPDRATQAIKPAVEQFIQNKYALIYKGRKNCGQLHPIEQFEIVETAPQSPTS